MGDKGDGWEFGKSVTVGAILKQLEKIDSVLSVTETLIYDNIADVAVEELILEEEEEIEDDDHTDSVEKISQLNEIIKNVGRMNVHDEVYNDKENVVERAKDLVNSIAGSL